MLRESVKMQQGCRWSWSRSQRSRRGPQPAVRRRGKVCESRPLSLSWHLARIQKLTKDCLKLIWPCFVKVMSCQLGPHPKPRNPKPGRAVWFRASAMVLGRASNTLRAWGLQQVSEVMLQGRSSCSVYNFKTWSSYVVVFDATFWVERLRV